MEDVVGEYELSGFVTQTSGYSNLLIIVHCRDKAVHTVSEQYRYAR